MGNYKNLGVISMLREKYENAKNFIKEHKSEIITGAVCIIIVGGASFVGYKNLGDKLKETNNKVAKNGDIARRALRLHLDKALMEKESKLKSIERLNPEVPINKFHLIPEREFEVAELDTFIEYILNEINECED